MEQSVFSIFNDALGPIMNGPSSSHSAGCCRIGLTVRSLYGSEIRKADIIFEEAGSYPSTYIGQGSSFGFTGGLLGIPTEDPRLKDAVELAEDWGREIRFKKADLGFRHPNQAKIVVYGEDGSPAMTVMTFSVGGGMFRITELDEFPVDIDGGRDQVFFYVEPGHADEYRGMLSGRGIACSSSEGDGRVLLAAQLFDEEEKAFAESMRELPGILRVRRANPVVPVVRRKTVRLPFRTAAEALVRSASTGHAMWELCEDYETGYGNVDKDGIQSIVGQIRRAMEQSVIPPDPENTPVMGFLPYQVRMMREHLKGIPVIDTGLLEEAMMGAIAVMENSCAHNIIVAAPTAGSSGVIPASVVVIGKALGKSEEEIEKALMAAGLVGVFIANQATFGGEVGACQAENGSASAMAAAGVIQLLGGTPAQGFAAAGMALQNMLGLICDPVAGLTEIPCISRNVSAMANAVLSANMIMLGFDPKIPLDEVILTMGEVGAQLPAELRCTCGGGLCTTPTGMRLQEEVDRKRPVLQ